MEAVYVLRPYKKSDINFIQNSWASSYYKGAEYNNGLSPKEFNAQHRPIRERLLNSPNTAVIVACDAKDDDLILGWILVEAPKDEPGVILHYLYVKEAFKGEGVSGELIKKALPTIPVIVTHMTDRARKIIEKKQDLFKDYRYSKDRVMIRKKYLEALPIPEEEE